MIFSPTCLPPQVNLVKSGEGGRAFWLSYYITIFQDAGHNSGNEGIHVPQPEVQGGHDIVKGI